MKKTINVLFYFAVSLFISSVSFAQNLTIGQEDSTLHKKPGNLWGLAYGDFAWKAKGDTLNRGGANQYTGIKEGQSLFQIRRLYLGYDYVINKRFEAEFLLALEDNLTTTSTATSSTTGNLLSDGKMGMFVKLANLKWKNIFPGSDLSFGEMYTPASVQTVEPVWDFRCIERTISDLRRTPTWDLGISLKGNIIHSNAATVNYQLMVGNGSLSRPENDAFKTFYGDINAHLLNGKIIIDLYADYTRLNWATHWHHDRNMIKGMVAYTTPKFTIGIEALTNTIRKDLIATQAAITKIDTLNNAAVAISIFARGYIYKDLLAFFVRYDNYNPNLHNNNDLYKSYNPITKSYDSNTKEQFFTAGLDYSPINKIHIMPNIWYNAYKNAGPVNHYDAADIVLRLSLYYIYGK